MRVRDRVTGPGRERNPVAAFAAGRVDGVRVAPASALTAVERAAWLEFLAADPRYANPFLHPAFAEACGRARDGVEVAVLESEGRPTGFFAFQRRDDGRAAELAGGSMADVQAPVLARGTRWDLEAALDACGLEVLEYDHLLADQPEFAAHNEALDDAPTIDIANGFDAYRDRIHARGSSVLRQIDRKSRKLQREVGSPRFELRVEAGRALESLLDWKRRRVREQGFGDVLEEGWVERLVREVAAAREPGFEGVLSVLWAGERPVAAHLGVLGGGVLASWIPAFDPDPDLAACSPGAVLYAELCRAAAAEGVARVDLGRGDNRLKSRLSTGAVALAIGAVDRRPLHRAARRARARLRSAVLASPGGERLRRGLRRVRGRGRPR